MIDATRTTGHCPRAVRLRLTLAATVLGMAAASAPTATAAPTLFPSDRLTVKDSRQATGKRVNLPVTGCKQRPTDCDELRLINRLDGFDLDPRVELDLGRRIDPKRVTRRAAYLQKVAGGPRIGLERLVYSPRRKVLYGHPSMQLEEATRYRLVVAAPLTGEAAARTTFTTLSATSGLRRMRSQLDDGSAYSAAGIAPASRGLRFDGVFGAASVTRIQRLNDKGPGELVSETVPNLAVAGAGTYAFGSFSSPSWLTRDRIIPERPTKVGTHRVRGSETVGFALILPAGAKPAGGFPVAIFGPGFTRSKYDLFLAADQNAARGIATVAIDPVGHAYGPRSRTVVDAPASITLPAHGRGRDLDSNNTITEQEGVQASGRFAGVGLRDGLRQTALDNMALVRAVGRGVDVDGDGAVDLRRDGVSYYGQSLGGIYGTLLMGADPRVRVAALNVPGGPILEVARLSSTFRPSVAAPLRDRVPSLLNGGRAGFTESLPLRGSPPVIKPARGAEAIQDVLARLTWLQGSGSPESFAPLVRRGGKRVLLQVALGDATVPNPASATLIRAGGLRGVTSLYRNDRTPEATRNPHGFLLDPSFPLGRAPGQRQVVDFLASAGRSITDPDGSAPVWEVPVKDLENLDELNFTGG